MANLKIFVYGTLKVGGAFAHNFDKYRQSNKPGKIKGTMFNIFGAYPGIKLTGDVEIEGEVHEYANALSVEAAFDRIEGYKGPGQPDNLYEKRTILVETAEGTEECIIYEYARDTKEFNQVKEGVWKI